MAQDLFRVEIGFADDNVHYLSGAGIPTGTRADAAPVGSSWRNTTNGDSYTKTSTGWSLLATGGSTGSIQTELDDTQAAVGLQTDGSLAWGVTPENFNTSDNIVQAVVAIDTALTAAETAAASAQTTANSKVAKAGDTMTGNLIMSGGATVTGLPTPVNATDAANKSYVDSAVNGITWLPPVNSVGTSLPLAATTGDRFLNLSDDKIYTATATDTWNAGVMPADGQAAFDKATETGYVFSGSDWVQFTGAGQIDAGTGLTKVGNVLNVNLGAGIAELPTDEIGVDVLASGGLFTTVNGSDASSATSAQLAVKLDGTTLTRTSAGVRVAQTLVDEISASAADLTTVKAVLGNARSEKIARNLTTQTVVDYVPTANAAVAKWIVHVTGTGANNGQKQVVEVLAVHNGNGNNATAVDFTSYAKLKIGGTIVGLVITVEVSAAGPTQAMQLKVTSTTEVDVATVREIVFVGDTVYNTHGEIVIA